MSYTPAVLTGHFEKLDGTAAGGRVEIIPNSKVITDAAGNIVLAGRLKVDLQSDGSFTVNLPPTDDVTLEPAENRQYTILVTLNHTRNIPKLTGITLAGGSTRDWADLASGVEASAVYSAFFTEADYDAVLDRLADLEANGGGGGGAVSSVNTKTGAVVLSASDVGADAIGAAATVIANHIAATDPHGDRAWTTAQINALIGGAPGLLDTLGEIAAQLATDESAVGALTTAVNNKVNSSTYTAGLAGKQDRWNTIAASKTASYTAAVNDSATFDTSSGSITQALPASPATNDQVEFFATYNTTSNALNVTGTGGPFTIIPGHGVVYRWNGSAWIERQDRRTKTSLDNAYASNFTGYDVILVAGQSNADDFGIGVDQTYFDAPDPRIKQYARSGTYVDQVVAAINPMLSKLPQPSDRIGFAMTFAKDYLDGLASAHRKALIVPCAVGGTGFTSTSLLSPPAGYYTAQNGVDGGSWDPAKGDGGVSLYQLAIDKANAAIATKAGSKIVAVLWLQGEGDAGLSQAAYAAKFDALIDGFRANITGATNVPFVVGQMVPDWASFNAAINAAHADTPNRKARTAFALGTTGMSNPGEPYHYNAAGQRFMGHSLYNAFATL